MDIIGSAVESILAIVVIGMVFTGVYLVLMTVASESVGVAYLLLLVFGIGIFKFNSTTSSYDGSEEMVLETQIPLASVMDNCYLCETKEGWIYRKKDEVSITSIEGENIEIVPISFDQEPYVEIYSNEMNSAEMVYIFHIPKDNN